jgi:hypothetical protein
MQIALKNLMAGTEGAKQTNRSDRQAVTASASKSLPLFEENLELREALHETPDVRAEKMARARALVADPNYPSPEQIRQVASLLAANWDQENSFTTGLRGCTRQSLAQAKGLVKAAALTLHRDN